ncbi:MAG: Hpt domain-containing protein [Pyrinomonadaceae bacterium]
MDDQLLREFLAEADDLIEVLFADIRALRARHADGPARRELVGRIFRHVHTIKGSAAAAGLAATGEIAHEFESLLDAVRMGRVAVDAAVLDALDEAVQAVAAALGAVARGEPEAAAMFSALGERLRQLASAETRRQPAERPDIDASPPALAALPDDIARSLSE